MIGTTLSGRYEIIERVGGGGMALVYRALDTLLNRHVAVKVLRQQFVHDEEFVRRFRREAQSAASLSHPNIVNIYDVGQEDETHYIVMEYIEGINLNEKIKSEAPLQVEEAVHIASQICDALDHAHANGIIHRDIKPHNILIGKNGRVKVTDFGIARATTTATITQTGSVIGSVHYFSPEHAKGVSAGEKSDLYSLGIVLYQMLTSKLPFSGESPISVALKHLQEPVEEPRAVNAMIPQSVENVILKSLRKRPEERYASAGEMLRDLETCLSPERLNEPKWTYASDDEDDAEATRVIPAIREGMTIAGGEEGKSPKNGSDGDAAGGEDAEEDGASADGAPVWRDMYDDDDEEERRNPWIKPLIWFAVLLVLLGAAWWGVKKIEDIMVIPTVEVPDVVGLPLERAVEDLKAVGLVVEDPIVYEYSREVAENYVISQTKAGETAKENTAIRLVVSLGIEMVEMPDLTEMTETAAARALDDLGFPADNVTFEREESDEPPGNVISQFPAAGQKVDPLQTPVRIVASDGTAEVEMPNLIGRTVAEAQALLEREGLELKEENIEREKAYFAEGRVYEQYPYQPGEPVKPPGEGIVIYVSDGLPDDARVTVYTLVVGPAKPDTESAVRVLVTDATGDRVEAVNAKVSEERSFSFDIVTAPGKNAVIELFRDDEKIGQYTWTYRQAGESSGSAFAPGGGGEPETEPAGGDADDEEEPSNDETAEAPEDPQDPDEASPPEDEQAPEGL